MEFWILYGLLTEGMCRQLQKCMHLYSVFFIQKCVDVGKKCNHFLIVRSLLQNNIHLGTLATNDELVRMLGVYYIPYTGKVATDSREL